MKVRNEATVQTDLGRLNVPILIRENELPSVMIRYQSTIAITKGSNKSLPINRR